MLCFIKQVHLCISVRILFTGGIKLFPPAAYPTFLNAAVSGFSAVPYHIHAPSSRCPVCTPCRRYPPYPPGTVSGRLSGTGSPTKGTAGRPLQARTTNALTGYVSAYAVQQILVQGKLCTSAAIAFVPLPENSCSRTSCFSPSRIPPLIFWKGGLSKNISLSSLKGITTVSQDPDIFY